MKAARPVVNRFLSVHGGICVRGRTHIYIYRLNVSMLEGEREEGRKPYLGR